MARASGLTTWRCCAVLAAATGLSGLAMAAAFGADVRVLDPLARAVVESVSHPPPSTPRQLLDAAVRTADVEAVAATVEYVGRLADALAEAGEGRTELLATLGDEADPIGLVRLEALLAAHQPDLVPVVRAIDETARARRRDPRRIAQAAAALRSPSPADRASATAALGRAGLAALPALADVLASDDPEGTRARGIARGLVRNLGTEGTQALLAQLGSADVRSWPAVIAALDATESDDIAEFLLAPAAVPGTPPEIRDRALATLRRIHDRCTAAADSWRPPSPGEAQALVARRLDRVLKAAGPRSGDLDHDAARNLALREALHLARDLSALGASDPQAVRLVLLARLAALVEPTREPAPPEPDAPTLGAALTGPDGVDLEAVADVMDLAASRGLLIAATAAARGIEEAVLPPDRPLTDPGAPLPPQVRRALVRALEIPDAALQFSAARTLALAAGPPPWPGASRVVETLAHACTAEGGDRVVVAHHDAEVVQEIATGVSRFGYRPVRVSSGRAAVLAARSHADTVLVILGARIIQPSAYETVQFIQEQPFGDVPPVLVVVDPLDDAARGKFLTKSILKFSGVPCVALVDRMESFFLPTRDGADGAEPVPPRFPAALEELAGMSAVDARARAARAALRLERGRQADVLLTILNRRGWDIPDAARGRPGHASAGRDPTGYNRAPPPPQPAPVDAALPEPTR